MRQTCIYDQYNEWRHGPDVNGSQIYEPSITERVVQHGLGLELQRIRRTDDVDNGDMFGKGWKGRRWAQ